MNFEDCFDNGDDFNPWDQGEKKASHAFELYERGQIQEALNEINKALEIDPSNSHWHFNKGLALDSMELFEQACESYLKALELNQDDIETMNCLAINYTRTGQYDLSIAMFEEIEKIDPDFEPCFCNRIIVYTEMGNYAKAEEMFYMAQQLNKDCAICFYNLGNAFFIQGIYDKAVWCWKKTAELEPEHPQINYRIAQGFWGAGREDEASRYFIEELRKAPGDVDVIFDFGLFLLHSGQIDSATEKFKRILETHPDFAPAIHYLGEAELDRKNFDEAEKFFIKASKMDTNLPCPRFRLAQCAIRSGRKDEAISLLAGELRLDPQEEMILSSIGVMMLELGQVDYAMHCFLKISEINPANAANYLDLGRVLAERGEKADAEQFLEYAIELDPKNVELAKEVSKVFSGIKDHSQAIHILNSVERFAGNDFSVFALKKKFQMRNAARKMFCRN